MARHVLWVHRDDGHALLLIGGASFTASVTFEGAYEHLYDQAGLMLRVDATRWIKIGIEYTDGATNFSIVVTDGRSDWSVVRSPAATGPQTVRLTLSDGAALGQFRDKEGAWTLMRLAPFASADQISVGPMACSPERSGFQVRFTDFTLSEPLKDALHG